MFDDLLDANADYARTFSLQGLTAPAAKRFALVTCIDSRIEPLVALGLRPGDAKILRNAGGRVTDDALRSLAIAAAFLDVERVAVMHHTKCAMVHSDEEIAAGVSEASGHDASGWYMGGIGDPDADLRADVERVRTCPIIPDSVVVQGWRYDVDTGAITPVVE